jgi:lysophospholipid acyltransferase (LPLAT)-like uncharacterized protein
LILPNFKRTNTNYAKKVERKGTLIVSFCEAKNTLMTKAEKDKQKSKSLISMNIDAKILAKHFI